MCVCMECANIPMVLSLVASHIGGHKYAIWIPPYKTVRWCSVDKLPHATFVGGHFRRLAKYKEMTSAVMCVCSGIEMLVLPAVIIRPLRGHQEPPAEPRKLGRLPQKGRGRQVGKH